MDFLAPAKYFPEVKIVPIAIKISATPAEWQILSDTLAEIITPKTLIIQSTDFSHYLSCDDARDHDQQTLRILTEDDFNLVKQLDEPKNLDSRAAQFIQLSLQKKIFNARPTIFINRNSQFYSSEKVDETTSYIIQFYSPEKLKTENSAKYFFAGDTFFGRGFATKISDEKWRNKKL